MRPVGSVRGCAHGGCFASGIAAFLPRFVLAVWWLFGSKVCYAFGSWVWPLLGLVFLPWTTLAIVIMAARWP